MLRITVELIPLGDVANAEVLGTGLVANDGTSVDSSLGHYDCAFGSGGTVYSGRVEDFPRELDVWRLLRRALDASVPSEATRP